MGIITISRELAALGDETAKELAKQLGWRFADKYSIEEKIRASGSWSSKLEKYDERKPSFWASISENRDEYLHYLKSAILCEASEGNCIFIGRGVFAILENVPGVLPVFLVSSMETRLLRVQSYFRCDEKRARQLITQSDYDRAGFHKFFFDKDWKEPENYYLTLNTSRLHPCICAQIIQSCLTTLDSDVNEECARRLAEMTLAQRVIHHIRWERKIGVHFLEAVVSGGAVQLYGIASSALLADTAFSAANEVPGVERVSSSIQIAQEYAVSPYKI